MSSLATNLSLHRTALLSLSVGVAVIVCTAFISNQAAVAQGQAEGQQKKPAAAPAAWRFGPPTTGGAMAPESRSPKYSAEGFEEDVLLVKATSKAGRDDIQEAMQQINGTVIDTFGSEKEMYLKIKVGPGQLAETEKKLREMKLKPKESERSKDSQATSANKEEKNLFECVQRNWQARAQDIVINDPFRTLQPYLATIRTYAAWEQKGRQAAPVAVLDTGTNVRFRDLSGRCGGGVDAIKWRYGQRDGHGHGTACASILGAIPNNRWQIAGASFDAFMDPIKVLKDNGSGDDWDIVWRQPFLPATTV